MFRLAIAALVTLMLVTAAPSARTPAINEAEAAHCTFWMCGPGTCEPENEDCHPTRATCRAQCANPASCHPVDICD